MMRKPKLKGYELLAGDVIDFDGVLYEVTDPITTESIGEMTRLIGIKIPYRTWFKQLLNKWSILPDVFWRDKIMIYYNNIYTIIGSKYAN